MYKPLFYFLMGSVKIHFIFALLHLLYGVFVVVVC